MTKLNWGMIGGGKGSQIGPAHRLSAAMDGLYTLAAGALDADPAQGRAFSHSTLMPACKNALVIW